MQTQMLNKTFALISLGCDKNRVDGERLLGEIASHGCPITTDLYKAQVLIVNTCAFLTAAREEAILSVLEGSRLKEEGKLEKLVVTGCLPQGYEEEVFPALTEADVFLGTADAKELFPRPRTRLCGRTGERRGNGDPPSRRTGETSAARPFDARSLQVPEKFPKAVPTTATYCLIPSIRGKYLSYPMEALLEEAKGMGETEELILVAQDITRYGEDRGENQLVPLLQALAALENIRHIRLLYCYPEKIGEELIALIRDEPKILKYLDIPPSTFGRPRLKAHGAPRHKGGIPQPVRAASGGDPGDRPPHHLHFGLSYRDGGRTSGAPRLSEGGEFHELRLFCLLARAQHARLQAQRAGASRHQTAAGEGILRRAEGDRPRQHAGVRRKTLNVLCDGIDMERSCFVGRAYFQAPDIDGVVYFTASEAKEGQIYSVCIDRAEEYDLFGHVE